MFNTVAMVDRVMRRREYISKAVVGSSIVGIAGCIGGSGNNNQTTTENTGNGNPNGTENGSGGNSFSPPETATVGFPSPALGIFDYAVFPGFQNQLEGSSVERQVFNGYSPMVASFVRGDHNFGFMALPAAIDTVNEGFPLRVISGHTEEHAFSLIVQNDISSWEELEGGTVAVHSPSSTSTAAAKAMIEQELGDPDAVEYTNILGTPNRLSAMQAGEVDAASVFASGGYNAEEEGYAQVLGVPWEYDVLSDQVGFVWVTLDSVLEENEDLLEYYITNMHDSYSWLYETDTGTIVDEALATDIYPDFSRDAWVRTLNEVKEVDLWPEDGGMSEENLERAQDLLVNTGLIAEEDRVNRDQFVDDRFL